MDILELGDPCLCANVAFQQVHRVVVHTEAKLQRLNGKPLQCEGSSYATNQYMEESLAIGDESAGIADIDKPAEQHSHVEKSIEY